MSHRKLCDECSTIVFVIKGGQVEIKARHHGEWHTTRIPLDWFLTRQMEIVKLSSTSALIDQID